MSVKSKLTKLAILGAVAGGIAAVVKKVKGEEDDGWQSSYDPPPAPAAPAPAPAPAPIVEEEPPALEEDEPVAGGDPLTDPLPPEDK